MADPEAMSHPDRPPGPAPRVHERAVEVVAATGARLPGGRGRRHPDAPGGTVLALAEAAEPGDPPRVAPAGGGCGGGRRALLSGTAVFESDGVRPTHLVARAVAPDGSGVLVLVERGDRGIDPWPGEGAPTGEIVFRSVRLDADRVLSGRVGG